MGSPTFILLEESWGARTRKSPTAPEKFSGLPSSGRRRTSNSLGGVAMVSCSFSVKKSLKKLLMGEFMDESDWVAGFSMMRSSLKVIFWKPVFIGETVVSQVKAL